MLHRRIRTFLLIALLTLVAGFACANAPANLLNNAGFEQPGPASTPIDWTGVWSRDAGAATGSIDRTVFHSGTASYKVVSIGQKDWALGNVQTPATTGGDIVIFSAWIKTDHAADTEIALVTRTPDWTVRDWLYGSVHTSGTHDWELLTGRCIVPNGVANVQFRLIGNGSGTVWIDDASLSIAGNREQMAGAWNGKAIHAGNNVVDVAYAPLDGTLTITDRRNGHAWTQMPVETPVMFRSVDQMSSRHLKLSLWDLGSDLSLHVDVLVAASSPEVTISIAASGAQSEPLDFPSAFTPQHGTALVVPINEGIVYPVDDATIPSMFLAAYFGHAGLSMPWVGIYGPRTGAGILTLLRTPDDAGMYLDRDLNGPLYAGPRWEASHGAFGYTRSLTYVLFAGGGYVAQAKWYRGYAERTGLLQTLASKRAKNPAVDRLIGAVDVWNWDLPPLALCRQLKSLGMDYVLWSNGGKEPDVSAINHLGYLTGRYDNYQDIYPATASGGYLKGRWPDDLVLDPNGDWVRGWAVMGKAANGQAVVQLQAGVYSSGPALERAEIDIPADLKSTPYTARFLDTTTASPWREDYSPVHPLTRSRDRANKMALLRFCSDNEKLVVGSETGIDTAVPYVDYFEGMMSLTPYRLPDSGRNMLDVADPTPDILKFQVGPTYRIPLWELVYHDCTVSYWYWGDYTNKIPAVWQTRDLFNILYATPPVFLFDRNGWANNEDHFLRSYEAICPLAHRLGYAQMLSHEFLTPDHTLQRTRWSDGTVIVVNFKSVPQPVPGGPLVKPMSWYVGAN